MPRIDRATVAALGCAVSLLLIACSDEPRRHGGGGGGGAGATAGGAPGGGAGGQGAAGAGGSSVAEQVCARWQADRADLSEGSFSGSVASCDAGDVTDSARDNALRLVNLYRWLSGLAPVSHEASLNAGAQACALMLDANEQLSHSPPPSWQCYSALGAETAGSSNLATTPGVQAVDLYMIDPGNPTTMGHRRWILSRSLGPIGLGTTSDFSCMRVIGGSGNASAPWTAYPSGVVPYEAWQVSFESLDDTGWTVQSDTIDLGGAAVTVTDGDATLPMSVTVLAGGYGSTSALGMIPDGWAAAPSHRYHVSVTGASQPIEYDVDVVDCP